MKRAEILAAVLPVERRGMSMLGKQKLGVVVYRHASEADANRFGAAEAAAMKVPSRP